MPFAYQHHKPEAQARNKTWPRSRCANKRIGIEGRFGVSSSAATRWSGSSAPCVDAEPLAMKSKNVLRYIHRQEGASGLVAWKVEVCRGSIRAQRKFSAASHGSERAALRAAKLWRDATLAQLEALHSQTPSSLSSVTPRRSLAIVLAQPHRSLLACTNHRKLLA